MLLAEQIVSAAELGAIIGVKARRVGQLAAEGVLDADEGKFVLGAAVQAFVRHKSGRGDGDHESARDLRERAQARKIHLEVDALERNTVLISDAAAAWSSATQQVVERILSVARQYPEAAEDIQRCLDSIAELPDVLVPSVSAGRAANGHPVG
jgi:hypothetical protein